MTAAKTKDKAKTADAPPAQAPAENLPAVFRLRLPYPKALGEYANIDQRQWGVLIDAIWPSAKTVEGVCMAINYCKSRNLDPFKKVVHVVPMTTKTKGQDGKDVYREIESVWPGIAEVRITATRTGIYAGKDAAEFGPDITKTFKHVDDRNDEVKKEKEVTFPEWCRITVYKIVQGVRCAFVGPKVYWEEAYATENRFSEVPNEMWADRRSGQLEKCTEAAALRAAFPEELGGELTAEEMYGRVIDHVPANAATADVETGEMTPPRPDKSAFARNFEDKGKPAAKAEVKSETQTAKGGGDPRPEPPAEGDAVVTKPVEQTEPETDEEEVEDGETTDAFDDAEKRMLTYAGTVAESKDLDDFKVQGRALIDSFKTLSEDEVQALRGQFTRLVLEETRARSKKGSRK